MESDLLLCYNRGCGSKFNPEDNPDGKFKHLLQCCCNWFGHLSLLWGRLIIGSDRRSDEKLIGADRASDRRSEQHAFCLPTFAHPQTLTGVLIYFLSANYIWVFRSPLISFKISFKGRFLCRLGFRVGFLYRLGFRIRVSSAHFCIFWGFALRVMVSAAYWRMIMNRRSEPINFCAC